LRWLDRHRQMNHLALAPVKEVVMDGNWRALQGG
jgi:hypothetical protein